MFALANMGVISTSLKNEKIKEKRGQLKLQKYMEMERGH